MSFPCTFSCDLDLQTFHSDYLKEVNKSPIIVFFIGNFLIYCSTSILRLQGKYGRFFAHSSTEMGHNGLRYQGRLLKNAILAQLSGTGRGAKPNGGSSGTSSR